MESPDAFMMTSCAVLNNHGHRVIPRNRRAVGPQCACEATKTRLRPVRLAR
jgi:hypothetical protein